MKLLFAFLAVLLFLFPLAAQAALGGDVASMEADRAQMSGSTQQRQAAAYTVHEIKASSGPLVREYASADGHIFAVAWQGQFAPDLQQVLGQYFDQYSAALKANKATYVGRRPLNLKLPGLIVQMNGYMRAYHFRAYIPQQVPAGVKQEELW
ncbi:MAG: DUF2844 domain-containing protein [Terriglobales bacterium]